MFLTGGGLISFDPDTIEPAGAWPARSNPQGQKPVDLPVQAPTNYDLVLNLKTAKAIGLIVPPTLIACADEVIEYGTVCCSAYGRKWHKADTRTAAFDVPFQGVKRNIEPTSPDVRV